MEVAHKNTGAEDEEEGEAGLLILFSSPKKHILQLEKLTTMTLKVAKKWLRCRKASKSSSISEMIAFRSKVRIHT